MHKGITEFDLTTSSRHATQARRLRGALRQTISPTIRRNPTLDILTRPTQHLLSPLLLGLLFLPNRQVLFLATPADLVPYPAFPAPLFALGLLLLRLIGQQLSLALRALAVILLLFDLLFVHLWVHDFGLDVFYGADAFLDFSSRLDVRF